MVNGINNQIIPKQEEIKPEEVVATNSPVNPEGTIATPTLLTEKITGPQVAEVTEVTPTETPQVPLEPIVTEPVIEPQIAEAPIEPTKIEEPIEPVVTEPTTPTGKVETVQDIKAKETSNEAANEALNEEKRTKATEEFARLVESGSSIQDIANFANKNKQFRDSFNSVLKSNLKNSSNTKFFGKYTGMSNENMLSAVNAGDVVVGSEQYNLLAENQRASFEQFQNQADAASITQKTDFTTGDKIISLNDLVTQMQGLFSFNLRSEYQKALNSPAINKASKELADKKAEIEKFDISIEDLREETEEELAGNLPGVINAAINDRTRDAVKNKRLLLAEYTAKLGEYSNLKNDAKLELDFLKFEDQQNKEVYQTALGLYESRRKEQLTIQQITEKREFTTEERLASEEAKSDLQREQRQFEEENRRFATSNALNNAKELAEFKSDLVKDKVNGTWEQRFDGLYFLRDDGVANKVINGGYERNDDGTSTYTYVAQDGSPITETYDITGQLIGAGTQNSQFNQGQIDLLNASNGSIIPTRLSSVTNPNGGKECAEYINDIFAEQIGARMGDTYQSKLNVATEKTGKLGSLAVWQPNPSNKEFAKFGHAGIIVGESDDGTAWHIKSSNLNLDGKISIVEVPKEVIKGYRNTNLYNKPEEKNFDVAQTEFMKTVDVTKGFNKEAKATIARIGLTEKDVFEFKAKNLPKEKTRQFNDILAKINNLKGEDGKFSSARGFSGAVGFGLGERLLPGTRSRDFSTDFESFKALLTVDNLDKMSGVLTDKDIEILKNAALSIELGNSEQQFTKRLKQVEDVYKKALGIEIISPENLFYTDNDSVQYTKESLKKELLRMIDDGEATAQEIQAWKKRKNLKF